MVDIHIIYCVLYILCLCVCMLVVFMYGGDEMFVCGGGGVLMA